MRANMPAMSLLPPDEDLTLIHTRSYETRVYVDGDRHVIVRGAVSDKKPPGLFIEDDPEPLEIHHMVVELQVEVPSLIISDANVDFVVHPNQTCPRIVEHYRELIGLSISRGFSKKVRELFGGPRGCTHTTALLLSMGPPVVQSMWSLAVLQAKASERSTADATRQRRLESAERNINTCHVWSEDGEYVELIRKGEVTGDPPIYVSQRLEELGRDPSTWNK